MAGFAGLFGTAFLMRLFKGFGQADGAYDSNSLVGRDATVVQGAPAQGYGTITIFWNGMDMQIAALASVPLEKGDRVFVSEVVSSSAVRVEKLHELPLS